MKERIKEADEIAERQKRPYFTGKYHAFRESLDLIEELKSSFQKDVMDENESKENVWLGDLRNKDGSVTICDEKWVKLDDVITIFKKWSGSGGK